MFLTSWYTGFNVGFLQRYFSAPSAFVTIAQPSTDAIDQEVFSNDHVITKNLRRLVEDAGAGAWPPCSTFGSSWPLPLKPYQDIFYSLVNEMTFEVPSLEDPVNRSKIDSYRTQMADSFRSKINLESVENALAEPHGDGHLTRAGWNGFLACIGFLRHAYRWGTVPVVKEAQDEVHLEFPLELDKPWALLQSHFGFTSHSGNLTSNVYNNGHNRTLEYRINTGMPRVYQVTEIWNSYLFIDMETMALPMYHLMSTAAHHLDMNNFNACLKALISTNEILTKIFKYFFDNLINRNVNVELWMGWVQGFHGWSAGDPLIDGVSGGQSLIIRAIDSYLGIRPWPQNEIEQLHIPLIQRQWLNSMRDYDIRAVAKRKQALSIEEELQKMVRQLRIWRMGHLRRMREYEGVPRPERRKMTAGKSVVDSDVAPNEAAMVSHLQTQLLARLNETR